MSFQHQDTYTGNAFTSIDFAAQGRQIGFVDFPHSPHSDAWGVTRMPIAVLTNGTGPTVVLEGGNHGDEYEGPITISELAHELDLSTLQGRLILVPAINVPALKAGIRTSPVDGFNFNRIFPGNSNGSISEQIAAYLVERIFPMADAFMDLHSGGSSLDILPSAIIEPSGEPDLHRRNIAAALAFGAPYTVVISNHGDSRTATATACRSGLVTVGTEMRGCGAVSLDALALCRRGVRNVLTHLGLLQGDVPDSGDATVLELRDARSFVYATRDGVFEPFQENGAEVVAGQPAGRIHCPWDLSIEPQTLVFGCDGIQFARRHQGRVESGNCCIVVASPYEVPQP